MGTNTIERRDFLKGAFVAGGAAAVMGLAGCSTASGDAVAAEGDGAGGATVSNVDSESIAYLLAKEAIRDKLICYCRGMDRVDHDLEDMVFAEGAPVDYGIYFQGTGQEFIEWVNECHTTTTYATHHRIFNPLIVVEGEDRASSETYLHVTLRHHNEDGQLIDTTGYGRYLDKWVKQDGDWRISERIYKLDMGHDVPIDMPTDLSFPYDAETGSAPSGPYLKYGVDVVRQDTSDPSYKILDTKALLNK